MSNGFYGLYIDGRVDPHDDDGDVWLRADGTASFESYVSQLTGSGNGCRLTDTITSADEDAGNTKITTSSPHHLKVGSYALADSLVLNGEDVTANWTVLSIESTTVATLNLPWNSAYDGGGENTFSQQVWDLYVDAPHYRAYEWRFDQCNINNIYFNGGASFSFYNCRTKYAIYIEGNYLKQTTFNNMQLGRPSDLDVIPHGPEAYKGWVYCGLTVNGPSPALPEFSVRTPVQGTGIEVDGTPQNLIGFELNGQAFKLIGVPEQETAPTGIVGALWIDTGDNTLKVVTE